MSALEKIRSLAGVEGPLDLDDAICKIADRIGRMGADLAAERQRREAAEARVAELEDHLAARQRRAELDAGGIGAVCPACGYELDEHGWCGMCTPEAVQP